MTDSEFLAKSKKLYDLRKQIAVLRQERHEKEVALNAAYKVDECNAEKKKLSDALMAVVQPLLEESVALEKELASA